MTAPRPADWVQREKLVAHHARWRCECIAYDHEHEGERCTLRGDHAQQRGSADDYRLPNLMWVCQSCARRTWPSRFEPMTYDDPTPTSVFELPHWRSAPTLPIPAYSQPTLPLDINDINPY